MLVFTLLVLSIFSINLSYAGVVIGSDMYFTSQYVSQKTNELTPTLAIPGWHSENTFLFVGLYPQISEKTIKGRAEIYVSSTTQNNIYLGGAQVTGSTTDGKFVVTGFAMSPALGLSDPWCTGAQYGSDIYTDPIAMAVRFSDESNTTKYPVIYNDNPFSGYNYALGGHRGVGVQTKAYFFNKVLSLEDYFVWNLNNFDSFGALLKLNTLDLGGIKLSAGGTAESLGYKGVQDFTKFNAYSYFDSTKLLPRQSTDAEHDYKAFGGFVKIGLGEIVDVFGQIKIDALSAKYTDPNTNNVINGYSIYAGAISQIIEGTLVQFDFSMKSATPNAYSHAPLGSTYSYMNIGLKAYGAYDLETFGMKLFFLVNGAYLNTTDYINRYYRIDFLDLGDAYATISGMDVKGSVRFDFFYMFRLRSILRYASYDLNGNVSGFTYSLSMFENRTYLDIDLEDVAEGLWTSVGIRVNSYNVTTTSADPAGSTSSLLPYVEVKYIFGEDSFVRLSWGMGEIDSLISQAYGIGYDKYRLVNNALGSLPTSGDLYNTSDNSLMNQSSINLEVGITL